MHQAEAIIEAAFAEPFRERERNGELVADQYADLSDSIRERIQQQSADNVPKTGGPRNRHDRRRAAVLGRKW